MPGTILIVDDDVDSLKLIGLMLQRQGYTIAAAQSGEQALALLESEQPDLMLLDVMMPDMDGYEVCRRIRKDPRFAHVPIMMFTAKTLVDDKVAGFEAGADDYLTKPTHPAELATRVKLVLERSQRQRAGSTARRGRVYVLLAARSGVGSTTVGINLAISFIRQDHPAVLAELHPGTGSVGPQLGFSHNTALTTLRNKPLAELSTHLVEGMLITHASRLRLLLASHDPRDATNEPDADHADAIVRALSGLGEQLIIDLGTGLGPVNERIIALADEVIVVLEPLRVTLLMTQALLHSLEALGVDRARIDLVLVNRTQLGLATPTSTMRSFLGQEILETISPAPELAFQAAENSTPMVLLQPDGVIAEQFARLARRLLAKQRPAEAPSS